MGDETVPQEHRSYPKSVQAGIPRLPLAPEGWSVLRLGDLLNPIRRRVRVKPNEEYQLVTARRNRGGIVERERRLGQDILTETQFHARSGDFLISRRQIAHGACGIVPKRLDGSLVSNEYATLRVTHQLDAGFLRHLPNSIYFQQTCFHSSIGVHVEKLVFSLEDWFGWHFNVPPVPEQRRIAAVLDAWDEAIILNEGLTAAKRQQRRFLSRECFPLRRDEKNSEKNLERTRLGDLGVLVRGVSYDPTVHVRDRGVSILTSTHIQDGRIDHGAEAVSVTDKIVDQTQIARLNDFLICMSNGSHILVGKAARVREAPTRPVAAGAFCATFRPYTPYHANIIEQMLASERYAEQLHIALAGSAIGNLMPSDFIELEFTTSKSEQLVNSLSVAAVEIGLLVARTDLLRRQRRGLMQRLLTGEVRVPESVEALMPGPAREAAE